MSYRGSGVESHNWLIGQMRLTGALCAVNVSTPALGSCRTPPQIERAQPLWRAYPMTLAENTQTHLSAIRTRSPPLFPEQRCIFPAMSVVAFTQSEANRQFHFHWQIKALTTATFVVFPFFASKQEFRNPCLSSLGVI